MGQLAGYARLASGMLDLADRFDAVGELAMAASLRGCALELEGVLLRSGPARAGVDRRPGPAQSPPAPALVLGPIRAPRLRLSR
jgi:hypothetical protein